MTDLNVTKSRLERMLTIYTGGGAIAKDVRDLIEDHQSQADRIAELRRKLVSQTEYSIKLQRLIESLKREDTPHPDLHHHKMIVAAKQQLAAAKVDNKG
jgi:hypothetical protein